MDAYETFAEDIAEFNDDYDRYMVDILKYRDLHSGTHDIDPIKSQTWIDSQMSTRRQNAAKNFIDNIHYFSLNQVFELIRDVVIKLYEAVDDDTDIYAWVLSGPAGKQSSSYFISMVALYFIRMLKYREPIFIVRYYPAKHNELINDQAFVIFDDCSYSGNQSIAMAQQIYGMGLRADYYICNAVASQYSLDKYLEMEGVDISGIKPIIGTVVPRLSKQFDNMNDFMDIRYYFSPYTEGGTPSAIIYFDHKLADSNSTYLQALNLGPILPARLEYDSDDIAIRNIFAEEYGVDSIPGYVIKNYLTELKLEEDAIARLNGHIKLRSIPLITGCDTKHDLSNIPYDVLMKTFNEFFKPDYKPYLKFLKPVLERCPTSFYKDLFQ